MCFKRKIKAHQTQIYQKNPLQGSHVCIMQQPAIQMLIPILMQWQNTKGKGLTHSRSPLTNLNNNYYMLEDLGKQEIILNYIKILPLGDLLAACLSPPDPLQNPHSVLTYDLKMTAWSGEGGPASGGLP